MKDSRYIKVILPLKLGWEPYYRVSQGMEVCTGQRVDVIFAGRRYIGVVCAADVTPDVDESKVKDILGIETHMDLISDKELELWRFIAEYYLCTLGEVYKLAYPAQKTSGEEIEAHAALRREIKEQKEAEKKEARLAKLRERLARKEESLAGRHSQSVKERLEEEISNIREAIKILSVAEGAAQEPTAASVRQAPLPLGFARVEADAVKKALESRKTVLLQGGESRIDVIMDMAADTLSDGKDVLMIVPDIGLSTHLQERLDRRFGDMLRIFHSAQTATNRRETASRLRRNGGESEDVPTMVLGTRSALFLPFRNLGLVIVEEEHDPLYKHDGAPRISGRDTAVMLGSIHGAGVILASPTPSLESVLNCANGRYMSVHVPSYEGALEIVDTTVEKKKNGMIGSLSRVLLSHMEDCLRRDGQILILRPWGPVDDLRDEISARWPGSEGRIAVTTTYEAKRLSMDGVDLLAIISADAMLDKQDFRADERAMQALEQLRSKLSGLMVIQTKQGGHQIFSHNTNTASILLAERKAFNYPPYSRMVDIIVKDANEARLGKMSSELTRQLAGWKPLGPFSPAKGKTILEGVKTTRLILQKDSNLKSEKKKIADIVSDFEASRKYAGHIFIDVDPV